MEQPPGFVAQRDSGLICRLRRSFMALSNPLELGLSSVVRCFKSLVCLEYSRSLDFLSSYELRSVNLFDCLCE